MKYILFLAFILVCAVHAKYTLDLQFLAGIPNEINIKFQGSKGLKSETLTLPLNDNKRQIKSNIIRLNTGKGIFPNIFKCPTVSYTIIKDSFLTNALVKLSIENTNKFTCYYTQINNDGKPFTLGSTHVMSRMNRFKNLSEGKKHETFP